MALFIQPENQNILWEMVNKLPLCNTVFLSTSSGQNEKNNWFKRIIGDFYRRIPPNISRNDLYQINRDVLASMMKSLGELSVNKQNTIDRGVFSRLDEKKSDFEIRQSQYNSMFEIQKPKAIDFSEKLDDDVITNMNELIENQRKMRELDLQQFTPKSNDALQNIKVNILEDVPKEVIQPQVLKTAKQVHFELQEESIISIKPDEICELKQKIENMNNKIENIFEMLTLTLNNSSCILNALSGHSIHTSIVDENSSDIVRQQHNMTSISSIELNHNTNNIHKPSYVLEENKKIDQINESFETLRTITQPSTVIYNTNVIEENDNISTTNISVIKQMMNTDTNK